jgi:tRNA(Leu) C34 or U34 (ribose-2'-O)-methylase TrmL
VDLVEHDTAEEFFEHASEAYTSLVGFSAPHRFGVQPLTEYDMAIKPDSRTCLVFGNETHGMEFLTDEQREAMNLVFLPISPAIRSLNLATCASIGLFEAVRQAGVTQEELVSLSEATGKRAPIGRWQGSSPDSQR